MWCSVCCRLPELVRTEAYLQNRIVYTPNGIDLIHHHFSYAFVLFTIGTVEAVWLASTTLRCVLKRTTASMHSARRTGLALSVLLVCEQVNWYHLSLPSHCHHRGHPNPLLLQCKCHHSTALWIPSLFINCSFVYTTVNLNRTLDETANEFIHHVPMYLLLHTQHYWRPHYLCCCCCCCRYAHGFIVKQAGRSASANEGGPTMPEEACRITFHIFNTEQDVAELVSMVANLFANTTAAASTDPNPAAA